MTYECRPPWQQPSTAWRKTPTCRWRSGSRSKCSSSEQKHHITRSTVVLQSLQCYRRQAIPMEQGKIWPSVSLHSFYRSLSHLMLWLITMCSVECYRHCSDGTVHYKSDKTVNFCGFRCATTSTIIVFIANQTCNTTVTGSFCTRYSRIWHDPVGVIFPVIGPFSLKRSQSECLRHDPVGQLTPVWMYCCTL